MIRKTLLTILLVFVTLTYGLSQGVIKDFLKYSTFYTSFSQSNSMVQEDTYAVMDGLLTVVPMEYEPNYTFSFGLRK